MNLKNKIIVVTGASNGIGRACVEGFVTKNAKVYGIDIDESNGKKLEEKYKNFTFIQGNISNVNDITRAKKFILDKEGKVNILMNNAAIQTSSPFFDTSIDDFKDVINTNLIGTFICSKIIGELIGKNGKIINMLSVHSEIIRKNKYAYDASKAGIEMLTKEMALELVNSDISVLGISYGACNTDMNKDWINIKEKRNETLEKIPMKWIAEPKEISRFVTNILENFSDYTTGNIFTIDGGRSLLR